MFTWITLGVLAFVLIVLFFWIMGTYNSLVAMRNAVKMAFAQIDVQLQRRYDLIPNLIEVAKKYMSHERETLEAVVQARNAAVSAAQSASANPTDGQSIKALMAAEQSLGGTLGRLFALREAYPDLKADKQMTQLMDSLTETENKISYSRQSYNESAMEYNTKTEQFPSSLIAGLFRFLPAELFTVINEEMRKAPKVEF